VCGEGDHPPYEESRNYQPGHYDGWLVGQHGDAFFGEEKSSGTEQETGPGARDEVGADRDQGSDHAARPYRFDPKTRTSYERPGHGAGDGQPGDESSGREQRHASQWGAGPTDSHICRDLRCGCDWSIRAALRGLIEAIEGGERRDRSPTSGAEYSLTQTFGNRYIAHLRRFLDG
jgi:hypothetical protein